MSAIPPRLRLAGLPTPLMRLDRLSAAWGGPAIWVKRDDLTGFGLSGNKVRKLEFHLAAAEEARASTVITCSAAQSNHCRATAVAAARVGTGCVLFLRTPDGLAPPSTVGNHLISVLAGATIRFVDPAWYAERDAHMREYAERSTGGNAWVIPEGASDGLGMWGYVTAAKELSEQLAAENLHDVVVWHAASSGGTTAGIAAHAGLSDLTSRLVAVSVSDPASMLAARISAIWAEAFGDDAGGNDLAAIEIRDDYLGGGYGIASEAGVRVQAEASSLTGLIFDPTYTGKAMFALHQEVSQGLIDPTSHIVFWHTGGGFAALGYDYGVALPK